MRVQLVLTFLVIITFGLMSCLSQTQGVANTLLDDYVKATTFSRARDVSTRRMRAALDELDQRIQAHRDEVLEEFFQRYRRLIEATRTVIDEQRSPESEAKLRDYVKMITGQSPTNADLIPASADAFTIELTRLRALARK